MCNDDVRLFMRRFGVTQVDLGETMGTTQPKISNALRKELPEEEKQETFIVIFTDYALSTGDPGRRRTR